MHTPIQTNDKHEQLNDKHEQRRIGPRIKLAVAQLLPGVGITVALAGAATLLARLPLLSVLGPLVLALLLGIGYRSLARLPETAGAGIVFSSQKLLRAGIILLGLRLDLGDIVRAGPHVLVLAVLQLAFALAAVYVLAKRLGVGDNLSLLTACGTAICGAAAVVAIAPQLRASRDETAAAAAVVALLGTGFTLLYTGLYPVLGLTPDGYGMLTGGSLHEVAHALAGAAAGGQSAIEAALLVKLTRVALLVPVALGLGLWAARRDSRRMPEDRRSPEYGGRAATRGRKRRLPVPWFIAGFLVMSGANTAGWIPAAWTALALQAAYVGLAAAMAGLGLGVQFGQFRRLGLRVAIAAGIGSVLLGALGYVLVRVLVPGAS
ncbi:putative sulfate exporter family transporter [Paenibacillus sp. IB182496]|uniref:Sulfate exporter family transporter n=1 Tax=Paenibacillus sabuli TaxID=2772509 RepID=A0A927BX30_9BACL|nr:putative sulfate exporter family transporter [Paenibacillus sabuli]MBD2847029.1 putative sulfate exporter family transporter [Paenibacillus sabuli]